MGSIEGGTRRPPDSSPAARIVTAVLLLWPLTVVGAAPARLWIETGGRFTFVNAYDEPDYLNYGISLGAQSFSRPGQYLVTMGHLAGLSGAKINLLLDLACTALFFMAAAAGLRYAGLGRRRAGAGAALLILCPMFLGRSFPPYGRLFDMNLRSGWVSWVGMPEAFFSPLFRSPEPQVSLVLLAGAACFAWKAGGLWPLWCLLPFLYPFLGVPLLFILLADAFSRIDVATATRDGRRLALGAMASFLAAGILSLAYFSLAADPKETARTVATRLPVLSLTGALSLAVYLILRRRYRPGHRPLLLFASLSPLAAENLQLVSGRIFQPSNFEQYAGTLVVVLLLVMAMAPDDRPGRGLAVMLVLGGLYISGRYMTVASQYSGGRLPFKLTGPVMDMLEKAPRRIILPDLSGVTSLIFPRQPVGLLSRSQTSIYLGNAYLDEYLCLKSYFKKRPDLGVKYSDLVSAIDHAYLYGELDFVLLHLNRRKEFKVQADLNREPPNCSLEIVGAYP